MGFLCLKRKLWQARLLSSNIRKTSHRRQTCGLRRLTQLPEEELCDNRVQGDAACLRCLHRIPEMGGDRIKWFQTHCFQLENSFCFWNRNKSSQFWLSEKFKYLQSQLMGLCIGRMITLSWDWAKIVCQNTFKTAQTPNGADRNQNPGMRTLTYPAANSNQEFPYGLRVVHHHCLHRSIQHPDFLRSLFLFVFQNILEQTHIAFSHCVGN